MILGIDEVGRGAWAGPLVVGAVVLGDAEIAGLNDSKKLSAKRRAELAIEIKKQAKGIGIGWVSAAKVDEIGLGEALKLASRRAVAQINCDFDKIIIDGTIRLIDDERVSTLPKADGLISAVSAASIVAKVARDNYMTALDKVFPDYNFSKHVGYGTKLHNRALVENGVLPVHRKSFKPVAQIFDGSLAGKKEDKISATVGRKAEKVAAKFLLQCGHKILAQNWKTKYCEVDIISEFNDTIYFTEVKYRKTDCWGDGLSAITKKKLNQMNFAARFWLKEQHLTGKTEAKLSVIALSGKPIGVENYIEEITF